MNKPLLKVSIEEIRYKNISNHEKMVMSKIDKITSKILFIFNQLNLKSTFRQIIVYANFWIFLAFHMIYDFVNIMNKRF